MKLKFIKKYFFLINVFLLISLPLKSEEIKKISGNDSSTDTLSDDDWEEIDSN